jgi:hypothetical protein
MEDWFEKLKGLWEWYRFYPPTVQWSFKVTLLFAVLSVVLFLMFHKSAAKLKAAADFVEATPLSVMVDKSIPVAEVPEEAGVPRERTLHYELDASPEEIWIKPVFLYFNNWNTGIEIEAMHEVGTRYLWRYPNLDIRFTNNTDKPLILNAVEVDVVSSMPSDNPVVLVVNNFDSQMSFRIKSPIPEELSNCVIDYDVVDVATATTLPSLQPLRFKKRLNTLTGKDDVAVDDSLSAAGADTVALRKDPVLYLGRLWKGMAPELGPFIKGVATVRGELRVDRAGKTLGPFRFTATVSLVAPGPQALMSPSITYELQLRESGLNYVLKTDAQNEVLPKTGDRITLRIGASRSSTHLFRVKLIFHDGQERISDLIRLDILRPQ